RDAQVRREVVTAIHKGDYLPPSPIPLLLESLKDEDSQVRQLSVQCLAVIESVPVEVVRALGRAALDTDEDVRVEAVGKLASLGRLAAPALPTLLRELTRGGKKRLAAIRGIEAIGLADHDVVLALCAALRDKDENVRAAAARALGKLGPATRQALIV